MSGEQTPADSADDSPLAGDRRRVAAFIAAFADNVLTDLDIIAQNIVTLYNNVSNISRMANDHLRKQG